MTEKEKEKISSLNLNTLLLVIGLLGAAWSVVKIGGPLVNLPEKVDDVERKVGAVEGLATQIQATQAVQAEAMRTLAEIVKESRELKTTVIRNESRIGTLENRVLRLEGR